MPTPPVCDADELKLVIAVLVKVLLLSDWVAVVPTKVSVTSGIVQVLSAVGSVTVTVVSYSLAVAPSKIMLEPMAKSDAVIVVVTFPLASNLKKRFAR